MLSVEEAEAELTAYAETVAGRDDMVRRAIAAGITKHRIHTLTGIARTTLARIPLEAPMPEVRIADVDEPAELHETSGNDDVPQIHPVYIKLDLRSAVLTCEVSGYADDPLMGSEQAGFMRTWNVPTLTAEAANRLMREILPLAQRVVRGWTTEPSDYASGGIAARLTSDGYAAEAEITRYLDEAAFGESDLVEVRNVEEIDGFSEWGLSGTSTDADLEEIERQIHTDLNNPNRVTVWYGLSDRLRSLRDEFADE